MAFGRAQPQPRHPCRAVAVMVNLFIADFGHRLCQRLIGAMLERIEQNQFIRIKQVLAKHGKRPIAARQFEQLRVAVIGRFPKKDKLVGVFFGQLAI